LRSARPTPDSAFSLVSLSRVCLSLVSLSLAACTPPPKVAGYSREPAAPTAPSVSPKAAPPPRAPPSPDPALGATSQDPPLAPTAPAPKGGTTLAEGTVGLPGGFAVEALSSRGSYVAYCQPVGTNAKRPLDQRLDERGNADQPVTLTLAVGAQLFDIDEVLAIDEGGRFVVTLESGVPWLHDTVQKARFSLEPLAIDLERDALPDHRSLAFSKDGRELAVVTQSAERGAELLVLDLALGDPTQAGRRVPLDARPWRVFAEGESFVIATATPSKTGPGWPVRRWDEPSLRCVRGSFDAFARVSGPLRDPTIAHAIVSGGEARPLPAPGFVMTFGGAWIRREDDGRLLLVEGKQQRQLASARCGGRILGADPTSGWFLVSCEEYRPVKREDAKPRSSKKKAPPPKVRFPLYLLKPGVVRDLDVELMRFGVDVPVQATTRFVAVRALAGLVLVDFSRGRADLLSPSDRVVLTTEREVLVASDGRLVRWAEGKRTPLGTIGPLEPTLTGPNALAVGQRAHSCCSHLAAGEHAGGQWQTANLAAAPLALGAGFALVPAVPGSSTRWARGPVSVVKIGPPVPATDPAGQSDLVAER